MLLKDDGRCWIGVRIISCSIFLPQTTATLLNENGKYQIIPLIKSKPRDARSIHKLYRKQSMAIPSVVQIRVGRNKESFG